MDAAAASGWRAGAGRDPLVGPSVLLLPLLAAVLAAFALYDSESGFAPGTPPAVADPEQRIAGWRGSRDLPDGSRVDVELLPLQVDPDRQRFDGRALAQRLGLEAGAPWRVHLRRSRSLTGRAGVDGAADAWDGASQAGSLETPLAAPSIAIHALRVVGPDGTPFAPLYSAAGSAAAGADPIRTLLAAPHRLLEPGNEVEFVVWAPLGSEARPSDASARNADDAAPSAARLTGLAGADALDLQPFTVARHQVSPILARAPGLGGPAMENSMRSSPSPTADSPSPAADSPGPAADVGGKESAPGSSRVGASGARGP